MNTMRLVRILAAATALLAGDASAQCKIEKIGEWRVDLTGNHPIIEGAINGQKVGILLDTGAFASLITRDTSDRLKLKRESVRGIRFGGVGGETTPEAATLDEFKLGEAVRKEWSVLVAEIPAARHFGFVLGDDFFERVDLELDLPHRVMRFYLSSGCEKANLAYWNPKDASQVALEDGDKIRFTTQLNGESVRTLLDTGATSSVVTMTVAMAAGFDPRAPGAKVAGCVSGVGSGTIDEHYASFDRFVVGQEAMRNVTLPVSDLWKRSRRQRTSAVNDYDMILGMDFLKTHRVFISRTARKMSFTYEGGLVFPISPDMACEGKSKERDASARLAEYNTRIAANSRDLTALLARSVELNRNGDRAGALRDLDAAIEIEPRNAFARTERGDLLVLLNKEHAKAVADYAIAIEAGGNNAEMYANRGTALHRAGDKARALESIETALNLDPRNPTALAWRGQHRLDAGDRAGAKADLELLEKVDPNGAVDLRKRFDAQAAAPKPAS